MFRIVLAAACFLASTTIVSASGDRYVAMVHILTTQGTYETNIITSTAAGVGLTECSMRKDAWWSKHGPMFEAIAADLAAKGEHTEVKLTCERK